MQTLDGRLYVVGGASRSGKTAWVRKHSAKTRRIFAWDPEDQWAQLPGWVRVTSRQELLEMAKKKGAMKVAYVAGGKLADEFDYWARVVMYSGRYVQSPLSAIAEELADVTTIGKAPNGWGILVRRGLKRTITMYALSTRWSEADKTALGNASDFVLFRQSSADDVRYLARKTRVPEEEINALQPLEFVHYDVLTQNIVRQKLKF